MIANIIKGLIIGIACILPGISGGVLAVSMGIDDKLIHCITHMRTETKKSIIFLMPILLGVGLSVVFSAFGLDYLFDTFPMQTNFLFIGLILGSVPIMFNKVKKSCIRPCKHSCEQKEHLRTCWR